MAIQWDKSTGLMFTHGGPEDPATEKRDSYYDLGLFLALIALVAWALFDGLGAVDWPAIGHTFSALLAAIL